MKDYFVRIGDAVSQLVNTIFGGDPNYSISGDAYRYKRTFMLRLIDGIFGIGHCESAYMNDLEKAKRLLDENISSGN